VAVRFVPGVYSIDSNVSNGAAFTHRTANGGAVQQTFERAGPLVASPEQTDALSAHDRVAHIRLQPRIDAEKRTGERRIRKSFDFSDRTLPKFPVPGLGDVSWINNVDLERCQLKMLLPTISNMRSLQFLFLSENYLRTLPDEVCSLTNLQELIVENNKLTQLPAKLGKLTQLKKLAVADNELTTLPASICQCKQLQTVLAGRNRLTELPEQLGKLRLSQLFLYDNQLPRLPQSVLDLPVECDVVIEDNPCFERYIGWLQERDTRLAALEETGQGVVQLEAIEETDQGDVEDEINLRALRISTGHTGHLEQKGQY